MKSRRFVILAGLLALSNVGHANPSSDPVCPVTIGSASLGPPFPASENWYGNESLAVILPEDGKWGITGPGANIAVKLFVWSLGFKPGMEEHLSVRVESLSSGPNDAVVKGISGAKAPSLNGSTMLAGIDFPSVGCWRLTLGYLGQSLSFVVETYDWTEKQPAT